MRKIHAFILLVAFCFGCTDLDVEPNNALTQRVAFSDFAGYESFMAKLYASLTLTGNQGPAGDPDLLNSGIEDQISFLRTYWNLQELSTDEAVVAWTDPGIRDLHNHNWGSSNPWTSAMYSRIFFNISMTNDFLRVSETLPSGLSADEQATIEEFKAEARFLRSFFYYCALDLFRNVPLITQVSAVLPEQGTPEQIFNFIETELNEVEGVMVGPGQNEYGRADRAALWALQARLYLNAEVFTGTARYDEALVAGQKVVDAGLYSLAPNYEELFMADNHLRTDEIIFAIRHDALNSQTWGGTTLLVRGAIGGAMSDNLAPDGSPAPDEAERNYGVPTGWSGYRTTSALVNKFDTEDGRFLFFTEGQTLEISDVGIFTQGYAVPKYRNIEASTGLRAEGAAHVETDFPLFRLAEVYLTMAEAELRSGVAVSAASLQNLNDLRSRAQGADEGPISAADVTLDFILDERARELYWEGHRRTDLVRFDSFSGGNYLWPWKGNELAGTSTPGILNLYPIPAAELLANPNITQNPGY